MCKHLREKTTSSIIMYFFFDAKNADAKDFRSLEKFYQTVLHQLLESIRMTQPELKALCFQQVEDVIRREGPGKKWYCKALHDLLIRVSKPSYLVIDALDECADEDVESLREWLVNIKALPNLQVLITSRALQSTKHLYDNTLCIRLQLSKATRKLDEDIEKYILSRIEKEGSGFPAQAPNLVKQLTERSSVCFFFFFSFDPFSPCSPSLSGRSR